MRRRIVRPSTPATSLVTTKAQPTTLAPLDERALDAAIGRVRDLRVQGAVTQWRLGREILAIYQQSLWIQRVVEDRRGSTIQRWHSFNAFCVKELAITHQQARVLMDVADHYSEEEVRAHGVHKLGTILTAPPERRAALVARVKEGASLRDLKAEVRAEKQRTSFIRSPRSGNTQTAAATKASANRAREENPITIARLNAVETVKLHERPPLGGSLRAEQVRSLPRAKHVRTGAIGIATTLNDVEE